MSMPPDQVSAFDDLATLARTGAPGLARASLMVQTDLFLQRGTQGLDGSAAFLPLALSFLPLVDEASARTMARKLAPHPDTPVALIEALHARGGAVAETLLELASSLPRSVRQAALDNPDPRQATRMAARRDLDDAEQLHLLGRDEPAVALALARNLTIRLARPVGAGLMSMARGDGEIAAALLERGDIDVVLLTPLYPHASARQRAMMRHEIGLRIAERGLTLPTQDASRADQDHLMETSLAGMAALIDASADICGRGAGFAAAASADASRDILALGLLGAGITPEDATRMLLRTGDAVAQSSTALHALVAMLRQTTRSAAETILGANWPRANQRGPAHHVPVMAPGGTGVRGAGTTSQPRSGAAQVLDRIRNAG
ncbi:MAG: DUF2336 domain-containing protein [Beijerinckiaceae bacterium]|jgi:hypothetical protein|nr:DUF2336 domain-containing protein [Beijerinckiaceae bacterium]